MVKLKSPLISLDARGTIGRIVSFVKRRGQNLAEAKPEPFDAKSPGQLAWRPMFLLARDLWHALSASEKLAWESSARPHHLTGYQWFMSQALRPNPGLYLPLLGGTMQGDITCDPGVKVDGVDLSEMGTPPFLPLAGGHMTGNLDMNNHYIDGLVDPFAPQMAVNVQTLQAYVAAALYTEGARAYNNAALVIPHNTATTLAFNSERWDTDTIHDNAINNSRLTCKTAGKYLIIGQVHYTTNVTGYRSLAIQHSAPVQLANVTLDASVNEQTRMVVSTIYDLAINEYVYLETRQTSGGNLIIRYDPQSSPEFMMQRIG